MLWLISDLRLQTLWLRFQARFLSDCVNNKWTRQRRTLWAVKETKTGSFHTAPVVTSSQRRLQWAIFPAALTHRRTHSSTKVADRQRRACQVMSPRSSLSWRAVRQASLLWKTNAHTCTHETFYFLLLYVNYHLTALGYKKKTLLYFCPLSFSHTHKNT